MNRQQNNTNDRLIFVPHAFWGQAIPSSSMIVFVDCSLRLFLAIASHTLSLSPLLKFYHYVYILVWTFFFHLFSFIVWEFTIPKARLTTYKCFSLFPYQLDCMHVMSSSLLSVAGAWYCFFFFFFIPDMVDNDPFRIMWKVCNQKLASHSYFINYRLPYPPLNNYPIPSVSQMFSILVVPSSGFSILLFCQRQDSEVWDSLPFFCQKQARLFKLHMNI